MYGWRSSGVNHVLIFELDPRNHLSEQDLMELASIFGVVWTLSVLSFIYSDSLSIPSFVNPLSLTIIMIIFLINPLKVFRYDARFWFLRICVSIVISFYVYCCATINNFIVGFISLLLPVRLKLRNPLFESRSIHYYSRIPISTEFSWIKAENLSGFL